jgi:hypothetical protein
MQARRSDRLLSLFVPVFLLSLIPLLFPTPCPGFQVVSVKDDYTLNLSGEYRMRVFNIDPIKVSGGRPFSFGYGDMRLRTNIGVAYKDLVAIKSQFNILDGVVLGDNGVWGDLAVSEEGYPLVPNEGIKTSALVPNDGRVGIGLTYPHGNPLSPDSYGPVLVEAEPITVDRLWGEVMLPLGQLRVGRQPATIGRSILLNDGDGLTNEFGVSNFGDTADRILLGTKPLEIVKVIRSGFDRSVADPSIFRGLITVFAYDFNSFNSIADDGTNVQSITFATFYRKPRFRLFGLDGEDLEVRFTGSYRWGGVNSRYAETRSVVIDGVLRTIEEEVVEHFGINLYVLTGGTTLDLGPVHIDLEFAGILGTSEEVPGTINTISPGFYKSPKMYVEAWGAQANVRYRIGNWELALEFDYASGDDDPRSNPASEFMFAEDTNVGLLLFEHIIAFERAQSAAAGTWNVLNSYAALGRQPPSNPSTRVATNGAFVNGIAVFPKVTFAVSEDLYLRTGVLVAWADKDVVDPVVMRTHAGNPVQNYNGGPPARFYGVEFPARLQYILWDRFVFDLEGAYLISGDALYDKHGKAKNAYMVEARFTFLF